jgi:Ran GTPase-activating protein (RanGAP) involved in mRNA processing and transport
MLVHRTVQSLDLPDNSLGDVGAAAIADLLDAGVKITSLQLSDNNIGDKGMARLARVSAHSSLELTLIG